MDGHVGKTENKGNVVEGLVNDERCLLCGDDSEQIQHLFFDYRYSTACLMEIKEWLGWKCSATKPYSLSRWISKAKQSPIRKRILVVVLIALVYNIWKVRNEALWELKVGLVRITVQKIIREIQRRLIVVTPKRIGRKDIEWLEKICTK